MFNDGCINIKLQAEGRSLRLITQLSMQMINQRIFAHKRSLYLKELIEKNRSERALIIRITSAEQKQHRIS